MNNTKWLEVFKIITQYPVYIQMKYVIDYDYHMDHERSDSAIN